MPLLTPQIQAALRAVNLDKDSVATKSLTEILDSSGLSLESAIEYLADIAISGDAPVRLRAIETALKLRGILKDQVPPPPAINIIINDPAAAGGLNPILFPRELSGRVATAALPNTDLNISTKPN